MSTRRTTSRWPDRLSKDTEPDPAFAGPSWRHVRRGTWVYQNAPGAARVQAGLLDNGSWSLDLWSAQNRLLAHGSATASEVSALAPVLAANAARWAPPSGREASQRRFAGTAEALRNGSRSAPDEARVHAATAASPSDALPGRSPALAVPPPPARPAPPSAARR
ncbi:hypothetical protein [Kitasatospora purpeofusca]|uniref:hypothetical protein n=1 Tax=Kitasatospora purpeofusca TaxID=67352 RepID=UPI0022584449|nr:hypothetical protein [Kitasatospora purpeofusca]MCX4752452.1 hypothetical protein [Kitasatospora purpeofusca]WSR32025.1 hypothetical protein OG715_14150 [Kitasatospora purpeofusca]